MSTTDTPTAIEAHALNELLARGEDVKVIDVRTPAEFESVHIPGAYNVPLDTLDEHRAEIQRHLSEPVILVCRSGQRAAQAERSLSQIGMPNVRVLRGGISAWEAEGAPVRRGRQRWDLERQVRLVAGNIVLGATVTSVAFEPAKWVAGMVGAGLAVAALTNTCAMGMLLAKLPYNRTDGCDVQTVVRQLTASAPAGR